MLNIALSNSSKFNSYESAENYRNRQINNTPILLGENGLYLVPANNKEAGMLIKAGYEAC